MNDRTSMLLSYFIMFNGIQGISSVIWLILRKGASYLLTYSETRCSVWWRLSYGNELEVTTLREVGAGAVVSDLLKPLQYRVLITKVSYLNKSPMLSFIY